jgi:hypothetical protein
VKRLVAGGCWLVAALAMPPALHAQLANVVSLGAGGSAARLQVDASGTTTLLSGITAFGSGRLGGRRFGLEGAYRQGSLTPDAGTGAAQDIVELRVLATARPLAWLQAGVGPHLRAYVVPGSTSRWVFIEGRVRAEGFVLSEVLRTHVELWAALSAKSNSGGSGSARGGEAGLTVRMPRSPVWARISYAIDRAAQSASGRVETLEDISLSIGFGRY